MTHKWHKLGLLYRPSENNPHPKLSSHAANPVAVLIDGDIYRIFFSGRDSNNRSSVGAVDINIKTQTIIHEHHHPFFVHGPNNSFYADGVSIANCYEANGKTYLLFMGWQTPANDHWRGDIGRLVINQDLSLELDSDRPLLSSDPTDPISLSYPWVISDGTNNYHMWYGSTSAWDAGNGEMLHVINYASSSDGNSWQREGLSIPYELGKCQAFSRPTVVGDTNSGYQMWFSYRGNSAHNYRIGYAHSHDGKNWQLAIENAGIDVSKTGWDSEMIEYPFVFDHDGHRYMLYNGNEYGKSGFGLAVLDNV